VLAVLIALLLAIAFTLAVFFFLGRQIMQFSDDVPRIKHNLFIHLHHIQQWVKEKLHVSYTKQQDYIEDTVNAGNMLDSSAIDTFTGTLLNLVLIPIYTFLILLYRTLFFHFFIKLIPPRNHEVLRDILFEIKTVVRSYIVGLLFELIIVAVLTAVGLWIIGVDYFIFLGLMTAILNLIPYIGILVAGTICIVVALAGSTEAGAVIGVIVVNIIVQFIDNNILVPKIIGSKISINALVSIVAVVIGGALAGIAGMFLALPLIAILKVIFDRIESLKPWGYVLGDHMPKTFSWRRIYLPDLNVGNKKEDS
jgi:predicted PurR-regulated permease PerM